MQWGRLTAGAGHDPGREFRYPMREWAPLWRAAGVLGQGLGRGGRGPLSGMQAATHAKAGAAAPLEW